MKNIENKKEMIIKMNKELFGDAVIMRKRGICSVCLADSWITKIAQIFELFYSKIWA